MNNMSKIREEIKFDRPVLRSNSYGNTRSRYLKEPTGSCHDLCKYGMKHDSKNDEKRLTFRKFIANRIALEAVPTLVKVPVVADGTKKMMIKMRASTSGKFAERNVQTKNDETSDLVTPSSSSQSNICYSQFILPETSDQRNGSLTKEIGFSDNSNIFVEDPSRTNKSTEFFREIQVIVTDDEEDRAHIPAIVTAAKNTNIGPGDLVENKDIEISQQMIESEPMDDVINHVKISNCSRNKKQVNRSKEKLETKSTPTKSGILKKKSSSDRSAFDSRGGTSFFKEKRALNLNGSAVSERLKAIKLKNTLSGGHSTSHKLQNSNQNAFLSLRKTNVYANPVRILPQVGSSRCLNGLTYLHGNSKNEVPEVGKMKYRRAATSFTAPVLSSMSLKTWKSKYIKHAALKKSGKYKEDNGQVHEKILEVFEPKTAGKTLELNREILSKESDGRASSSALSEASEDSFDGRIQRKHIHSSSKEGEKRRARRTLAMPPKDNFPSPYKLKFRKAKVIEFRAAENVGPKRLKFRRGRVLGDNPSGDVVKRSSRMKRDIGESKDSNSETHMMLKKANLECKGVKLKHQDAHVKKDTQPLFNHVIEETASKLVEMRKSKVKALVGAFESVISLQEPKPASMV